MHRASRPDLRAATSVCPARKAAISATCCVASLGGVLGGAAAGTVLNGGLGGLLKQLQESGQGDAARSWVGSGQNKTISQGDLANALGSDTLDELSEQTGMDRGDLLSGLSQHLPRFVDQLTPDGRLPTEEEAHRMV